MTTRALLDHARSAGVELFLLPDGSLGYRGPTSALASLLPELRDHKADLIAALESSPPLTPDDQANIAEALEERAAIREYDGSEPRAVAEREAAKAMRVYQLLIAMPEGPPRWVTMLAPGCDLEEAHRDACLRFGAERVLRIEPADWRSSND